MGVESWVNMGSETGCVNDEREIPDVGEACVVATVAVGTIVAAVTVAAGMVVVVVTVAAEMVVAVVTVAAAAGVDGAAVVVVGVTP
jgi:hypothetical protein